MESSENFHCLKFGKDDEMFQGPERTPEITERDVSCGFRTPEITEREVSCSMILDKKVEKTNKLATIQNRQRSTWVDDESVKNCFSCKQQFGFYIRKHHCRMCGQIFCYHCTRYRMDIPEHIENLPTGQKDYSERQKARVCRTCAQKAITIQSLEKLLNIFDYIPLTVNDYRVMSQVSKQWNQVSNYYLSKFREIQYKLPHQRLSGLESRLLWNNRDLFSGHSQWLVSFIRSMDCENYALRSAWLSAHNNINNKTTSCRSLMCSRLCRNQINSMEAVLLLEQVPVRPWALKMLNKAKEAEISCYVPYLVHLAGGEEIDPGFLGRFLIDVAKKSDSLAVQIFWEFKIKSSTTDSERYRHWSNRLLETVGCVSRKFIEDSMRLINFLNDLPRENIDIIKARFVQHQSLFKNLRLVTCPELICQQVIIEKIQIKDSASKPLFLPLKCYHTGLRKYCDYYLLYKFEDVRQDQLVLKTITLMDLILQSESNNENQIVTYCVFPTSAKSGIIEIIPNCLTIFEIKKRFTIFNYILENNIDSNISADQLRRRFLKSCAAYCVITYLLGVGDRHLDNIMITKNGQLFHIDYGFIIGSDPKPMNHPKMRITVDMVDALGGQESIYYKEFVDLCHQIHQCLRRRLNLFLTLLALLVNIRPPIQQSSVTMNTLIEELIKRFMHGENYEQAQLQLTTQIGSSSDSYNQAIVDFFHYHQREQTIPNLVGNTFSYCKSFFGK